MFNDKQHSISGAATTITSSDLTADFALVSHTNGKVDVSTISTTPLGYLSDVKANQTTCYLNSEVNALLNGKQATTTGGATTI